MDLRDRLLREATRSFAERGYRATSLQDVASAAGVTKQALLYHFGSKEALKEAVLQRLFAYVNGSFVELLAAMGEDEGQQIDQLLAHVERVFEAEPHAAPVFLRMLLDATTPEEAVRIREGVQPWFAFVTDLLRRGQEDGRIRRELALDAAVAQVGMLLLANFALLPIHAGTELSPEAWRARRLEELIRSIRLLLFTDEANERVASSRTGSRRG